MEGEDRKDLWRELVTVCGGSKDPICKFRFCTIIPCVVIMNIWIISICGRQGPNLQIQVFQHVPMCGDHGHDYLDSQYLLGKQGPRL